MAAPQVSRLKQAAKELADAESANDVVRWQHAKQLLDQTIVQARRAEERANAAMAGATAETRTALETATTAIAADVELAATAQAVLVVRDRLVVAVDAEVLAERFAPRS